MKKVFLFVLLILGWQCTPPKINENTDPYYLYDSNQLLNDYMNCNDSIKYLGYETCRSNPEYYDSILIKTTHKYYMLMHYLKYLDYKDTSFSKHKTYLDSIKYYDNEWLENEEKLDSFWLPVTCWRCSGIYDTMEIYLILPVENTDSLIIRQVHRKFHRTR